MDVLSKRLLPLIIYDILSGETHEGSPMTTAEILSEINKRGVKCNRKTLDEDIKLLNKAGFEVMKVRSQSNKYFVADRKFDFYELRILIDALRAATFITEDKTEALVAKVASLAGIKNQDVLKAATVAFCAKKNTNEHIFYSIAKIDEAISKHKKIEFTYFDYNVRRERIFRDGNKKYVVNPLATVFDNDKYYLLCFHDKHDGITHYRIDRMDKVDVTKTSVSKPEWVKDFDIKEHTSRLFGMFGGKEETVTFRADKKLIDVIFDKFGKDVALKQKSGGEVEFTAAVQLSPPFYSFLCGFGSSLRVTAPASVVQSVRAYIDILRSTYSDPDTS